VRAAYNEYPAFFYAHRDTVSRIAGHEEAAAALGRMDPAVFDRRSNESFSLQWRNFEYDDQTWFKDDIKLRKAEFLQSLNISEGDLEGALVLDAGCGNGKLTASVAHYGAEVVGMDLSESVVRAHANRASIGGDRAPFVHFIQGNVMEPPLAPQVFDHIHSSGVLHHTPNTESAFLSFLTMARSGAKVYVQLYRRREAWVGIPNLIIRTVTKRLPPRLLFRLCWAAVPIHTMLVLLIARLRREPSPIARASRRERALSLFDNYSPRYQYRYTPDEIRLMFESAGLRDIRDVTLANEARHMVAFVGRKDNVEPTITRAAARVAPIRHHVSNSAMGATSK
jgi:2-polyprenyl-3-methyl-5-hydroxy-6-metoxy-1,4-benzoquinol methylase